MIFCGVGWGRIIGARAVAQRYGNNISCRASVLLLGGTGGLGGAIGRELAGRGAALTLVARDQSRLEQLDLPGTRVALDL